MVMQFEYKQDYEITYNFGIHNNHSKHHLHHKNNCTSKTAHAVHTAVIQKTNRKFREHNWSSRPPINMNHNFLKIL